MEKLFYLVGPSGSGKDSLLRYTRQALAEQPASPPILFAHRYITRPTNAGDENHVVLSETEFDLRLANDLFALHWQSHGYRYGIGVEIDAWLKRGLGVVVSGSRGQLRQALQRYPALHLIWVQVDPAVLHERLLARAREDVSDIELRLQRAGAYAPPSMANLTLLDNNGPLAVSAERLLALLR